jgi:hypothetical protein
VATNVIASEATNSTLIVDLQMGARGIAHVLCSIIATFTYWVNWYWSVIASCLEEGIEREQKAGADLTKQ